MTDLTVLDELGAALKQLWPHGSASLGVNAFGFDVFLHQDGECYMGSGKTPADAFRAAREKLETGHAARRAEALAKARALVAAADLEAA